MVSRTLSRYQVVDQITRGGMGVVYRAIDVRLGREVALRIRPVADSQRRQRFVQETGDCFKTGPRAVKRSNTTKTPPFTRIVSCTPGPNGRVRSEEHRCH
jgi:serine/threonine protein kinase